VETLKFITDGMLGKLTRWLRMLGQNVEYSRFLDDKQLIEVAKKQSRVLLTRDLRLYQQAVTHGVSAFLVEGTTEAEKLANLAKRFDLALEVDVTVSRCPKCNTQIKPVSKDKIVKKIPQKTSLHYNEFWMCPNCEQIYWQGAHWKRIDKTLRNANQELEKLDKI
jgi:uncharacterized protein with PIN domain